jgi:hypothetical protein
MDRLPGVSIRLFERDYDLAFGRQHSGTNWLMAVNRETGAVLPLTSIDWPQTSVNTVEVLDVANFVPALEEAGIIKRQGPSKSSSGFKLCPSEIIHAGLIERLAGLESKIVEMKQEREEHSR